MQPKENQNQENVTEENLVSAPPKQEVVESIFATEEIKETENQTEQIENSETEKSEVFSPMTEIINGEPKQTQPTESAEQPQEEKTEEISQIEPESTLSTIEIKQPQPIQQTQTQETPTQPQIKTVEKIIYQTSPNFIQNLLNKARAKIQERKRKKLDKILLLFETKSQMTNSDIQKLLRVSRATAKRYMDILEKENKATQVGNTGKGVFYTKKQ